MTLRQAARHVARSRVTPRGATTLLAAALALAAFLAAVNVSTRVFDRVPHVEDEVAFLFQARVFAAGELLAPAPARPEFFSAPFVIVRDGDWFGKYPPGHPAVLALGMLVGAPWLVNPLAAAVALALLTALGSRLYGLGTAVLAGALLLSSPFFLLQSGSYMSHVVSLCWTLAFILLFDSSRRRRSVWLAAAAGLTLGALFLTRPLTAVAAGLPFAVWAAADLVRERRRWRAYLAMAASFAPAVVALLAWNRVTTGDPFKSAYELWWSFDRIGFGEGIGIYGRHTPADGWRYTRINLNSLEDVLFGWPADLSLAPVVLAVATSAGLLAGRLLRRLRLPRRGALLAPDPAEGWDLTLFAVFVALVAVHVTYPTPGQMYGPRYYFEALGPLALLAARGILRLATALGHLTFPCVRGVRRASAVATVLTLAGVVALSGYAATHDTRAELRRYQGWNGIDGAGPRAVSRANVGRAVVFIAARDWPDYAPFFVLNDPNLDGEVVYAIDRGLLANRELLAAYPGYDAWRYRAGQLTRLLIQGSGESPTGGRAPRAIP